MTWQRNEGREQDELLQNKLTAYLLSAVQRRKALCIDTLVKAQQISHLIEETAMDSTFELEQEALQGIPLYMRDPERKAVLVFISFDRKRTVEEYHLGSRRIKEITYIWILDIENRKDLGSQELLPPSAK